MFRRNLKKWLPALALMVYSLGVLLALALIAVTSWADYEAQHFEFGVFQQAEAPLRAFACPLAMTADEVAIVRARLTNRATQARQVTLRAHVSEGYVWRSRTDEQQARLAPGGAKTFTWSVAPQDAVWDRVILVRVYAPRNFAVPPRTASCGILLLGPSPLGGGVIVGSVVVGSLLGMGLGLGLWVRQSPPALEARFNAAKGMAALAVLVVSGLLASSLGAWALAGVFSLLSLILGVAMAGSILQEG